MAQTIKLKRSSVPGKVPDVADLKRGELAINTHDGKIYLRRTTAEVNEIIEVTTSQELLTKIDVIENAVAGNLTTILANGNIQDSGFSPSSFATSAQGVLADSALQAGANISLLNNDSLYLTPGDNNSLLTNDAGYISNIANSNIGNLKDVTFDIAPQEDQVLKYIGGNWTASNDIGEVNLAGTVGNGIGVYHSKLNTQLRFKSLIAGDNVNIIDNGSDITISATAGGSNPGLSSAFMRVESESGSYIANGADSFRVVGVGPELNTAMTGNTVNITLDAYMNTLQDVNTNSSSVGQYLSFDGSNWVNKRIPQSDVTNLVADLNKKLNDTDSINRLADVNTSGVLTPGQALTWSGVAWIPSSQADVSGKADKVSGAANGRFAGLNSSGNLTDSGFTSFSFATSTQGTKADNALQSGDKVSSLTNDANYMAINSNSINQLQDVNTAGATQGQVLKWNGFVWEPGTDDTDNSVRSVFGRMGDVIARSGDYSSALISYSNTSSGLSSAFVQGAVDEVADMSNINSSKISSLENDRHTHGNLVTLNSITSSGSGQIISTSERNKLINSLSPGDNITELSNNAGYLSSISSQQLGGLGDVNVDDVEDGEVLKYFGGAWASSADSSGEINLSANVGGGAAIFRDKTNVTFNFRSLRGSSSIEIVEQDDELVFQTSSLNAYSSISTDLGEDLLADGQDAVTFAGGTGIETTAIKTGQLGLDKQVRIDLNANLGNLNDVDVSGVEQGYTLEYNGTKWTTSPKSSGSGAVDSVFGRTGVIVAEAGDYSSYYLSDIQSQSISDLSDVSMAGIQSGQVLKWNGTGFIPADDDAGSGGGVPEAPVDGKQYARQNAGWSEVSTGAGSSSFESVRVNYNAFGTISGTQSASSGISSTTVDAAKWVNFEFNYNRPPSSIMYYGYTNLGAGGWGYKLVMPSSGNNANEVRTGGTIDSPAELLTNMAVGKLRLQCQAVDTFSDVNQHAYIFFIF